MSEKIINQLKKGLKETDPHLSEAQISRRNKIINSDDPEMIGYGHKVSDIEMLAKNANMETNSSYEIALEVFQQMMNTHIHEEKFAAFFFLNCFKKSFDNKIVEVFKEMLSKYCDCWAICDSSIIRVLGPYLAQKGNGTLAIQTIEDWSDSEIMWVKRASMVILLKITMVHKKVDAKQVFSLVEKMLSHSDDYIQKGIGWLLKTCSNYDTPLIIDYLQKNKTRLSRLILRYASEKLPKETRDKILKK